MPMTRIALFPPLFRGFPAVCAVTHQGVITHNDTSYIVPQERLFVNNAGQFFKDSLQMGAVEFQGKNSLRAYGRRTHARVRLSVVFPKEKRRPHRRLPYGGRYRT